MKTENIKFKAKRIDTGEWVQGDIVHGTNYVGISRLNSAIFDVPVVYKVDPDTVCQFTGLTDCEGKEVWEGDIIKSPYLENLATVEWDNSLCGFKCVDDRRLINYSLRALVESSGWSLIGNKFDKEK